MRVKQKLSKLISFAIALALTFVIGTVTGMLDYNQASALNLNLGGNAAGVNHHHSAHGLNVNSGSNTAGQT